MITVFCIMVLVICCIHFGYTFEDVNHGTYPIFFSLTDFVLAVFAVVVLANQ